MVRALSALFRVHPRARVAGRRKRWRRLALRFLVAADPARGAVFLVEETGVVARWASSAYRRGALGAKTVASMVPSCPIGSMVPGGLRLLHW